MRRIQTNLIQFSDLDSELASVLTAIGKNPSIKSLNMTRSFTGMKIKHIVTVMDSLVNLIQKDDFPLTELILSENKLKNDIHDFINALGSNQSLQRLGEWRIKFSYEAYWIRGVLGVMELMANRIV